MAEGLTINAVDTVVDGAWRITDGSMHRIRGRGSVRANDFVVHGLAGEVPEPAVQGGWRVPMNIYVYGTILGQTSGAPSSKRQGVIDNIEYLKAQWLPPYSGGSATISATLEDPDGGTATADVRVENLQVISITNGAAEALVTFDLYVPAGKFA